MSGRFGVTEVRRLGPARLTAGLDRWERLDLPAHARTHGPLPRLTRDALLALAEQVDLRGRGGAGFPFARKARATLAAAERTGRAPVLVVNGTEGEPPSLKDATLLGRAPHLVLDGVALAAAAFGAAEVVVAVAAGSPGELSVPAAVGERVRARRDEIRLRTVCVPERFVSGESGALVRAINGDAALPPSQPARAAEGGRGGVRRRPTLLCNAETWAQLAVLSRLGADAYAVVGTPEEPGTLLVTVNRPDGGGRAGAGAGRGPVVVEVPAGAPLGVLLDACGVATTLPPSRATHRPPDARGTGMAGVGMGSAGPRGAGTDSAGTGGAGMISADARGAGAGSTGSAGVGGAGMGSAGPHSAGTGMGGASMAGPGTGVGDRRGTRPRGTDAARTAAGAVAGVLVGGYHGAWLAPEAVARAVVSRAGLAAVGGTLGAASIVALPDGGCPLAELARVTAWLAGESAGQCGPCRRGLPETAAALAALVRGAGSAHAVREAAVQGRGRGACAHPDGTARFVLSGLAVFADDVARHEQRGGCGRPVTATLPLPPAEGAHLALDWARCDAHGLCAALAPDLLGLDAHGYPVLHSQAPLAPWQLPQAHRAVAQCPALALRVRRST